MKQKRALLGQPNNERHKYRSACTFCGAFNRGSQKIKVQEGPHQQADLALRIQVRCEVSLFCVGGIATYADNGIGQVKPIHISYTQTSFAYWFACYLEAPGFFFWRWGEGPFMFSELSTGVYEQAHTSGVLGSTSEKAEEIISGIWGGGGDQSIIFKDQRSTEPPPTCVGGLNGRCRSSHLFKCPYAT